MAAEVDVSEYLRLFRRGTGVSQRALSKASGINVETISKWERGLSRPSKGFLRKLDGGYGKLDVKFPLESALDVLADSTARLASQLAVRFRLASDRAGMRLEDAAMRANVSQHTLNAWLQRGTIPGSREAELINLAIELDVSPQWLRAGPNEPIPAISHQYYNELIVSRDNQWKGEKFHFRLDEFLESSDSAAVNFFDVGQGGETFNAIGRLPVLLIDLRNGGDIWRLTGLKSLEQSGDRLSLQVDHFQKPVAMIPPTIQPDLANQLGLTSEAFLTTRWSLRRGDIRATVQGVFAASRDNGNFETDEVEEETVLSQRPSAYQFGVRGGSIYANALRDSDADQLAGDLLSESERQSFFAVGAPTANSGSNARN